MRKIDIEGQTFEVRPLKRREVRVYREAGLDLGHLGNLLNAGGETQDEFLERVCPGQADALSELDNNLFAKLLTQAWGVTWGLEEERKNSEPSGAGEPEAAPTTATPAA